MKHVIVIGGGAAGCMAAVAAAQKGAAVTLLERNPKLGRKLYITGKGRCNVTNDCAAPEVLQNVPRNSRFLTSAVTRFPPEAVKAFFEGLGVPLKTERGNRVFPCSDKAADIIDALLLALRRSGVHIVQDRARALRREGEILTGVEGERGFYPGGAVVIATGGVSYPLTGSTGDGYALAEALGHTILPPRGSLVPLVAEGDALHHCVGTYAKDHANGKTAIFFIRRAKAPRKSFYTLELNEGKLVVRENRGRRNCARTKEVEELEAVWLAWLKAGAPRDAKGRPVVPEQSKQKEVTAA